MLKELTIQDFVNELSSSSPAPGGGSAAALAASLANALNSMVFNLTIGKKAYNALEEEIKSIIDNSASMSSSMKETFLELMEKDTEAFLKLMSCFKLPKDSESEKAYRKEKIEDGYKRALEVPLEIARKALVQYENILVSAEHGNVNAISDAGVAALLNQAALESAVLNVNINLSAITDTEYKAGISKECSNLIAEGNIKKAEIMNIVNAKIGV